MRSLLLVGFEVAPVHVHDAVGWLRARAGYDEGWWSANRWTRLLCAWTCCPHGRRFVEHGVCGCSGWAAAS